MFVARKNRTNASAIFVSLSAVGMALGPLLALPLQRVPEFKVGTPSSYPSIISSQICSILAFSPLLWV